MNSRCCCLVSLLALLQPSGSSRHLWSRGPPDPPPSKGCRTVTYAECGNHTAGVPDDHSCLKCGNASAFDCEYCCPGCTPIVHGQSKLCDCTPPGPPPGNDTWTTYNVGGMAVIAVTGGKNQPYAVRSLRSAVSADRGRRGVALRRIAVEEASLRSRLLRCIRGSGTRRSSCSSMAAACTIRCGRICTARGGSAASRG